jgi:XTP/dITP diphosphohydrolase
VAEGKEEIVEGVCRGAIIEVPRGSNGFGYDPVFLPEGYRTTLAEMDLAVKNRVSHRGVAIQKLKKNLPRHLTR